MAKKINFHKMVASGNDFVVIDNRRLFLKSLKAFAKRVCQRNFGVGADGVLLMERPKKSSEADIKMRIFNSDGSEAEMCGNGARAAALYARKVLGFDQKFIMETKAGLVSCVIKTWTVQVQLTAPFDYKAISKLKTSEGELPYYYINTGVPHVVSVVESGLSDVDVAELGREVRFHKKFQPKGANVNFIQKSSARTLKIRTYERGVEDETLACGTGSVASAIVASLNGLVKQPVEVKTKSGEVLKINFDLEGETISNVTLEGNAEITFEGSITDAV